MIGKKEDHIKLASLASTPLETLDQRFSYDPVHGVHPDSNEKWKIRFGPWNLNYPVWISSMTGGAEKARNINERLARLCGTHQLGMGLGSCRKIVEDPSCIPDFQVKKYMADQPLFANLGLAQCEAWLEEGKAVRIHDIISICEADGLIIHLNPLQEWMQPEGDRIGKSPIETIKKVRDLITCPMIVKEVGQGISYDGLLALMQLDLLAVEFGAYGGTNFALLELLRDRESLRNAFEPLTRVGHTAHEMIDFTNHILSEEKDMRCRQFIISGGIKNFLDGYYFLNKSNSESIYGMASAWLEHAMISYEALDEFFKLQMQGLLLSRAFLKIKSPL